MKNKYSNKYLIETGIGLQDVDGLKNSSYFLTESNRYVKGEISLEELDDIITSYYKKQKGSEERTEEADKISVRIAKLISEDSFTFSVGQLLSIHQNLFSDILYHAGTLRQFNITKSEWVLDGATVIYGDYRELKATLQFDFEQEKAFHYDGLSMDEIIDHLAMFVSNLWQIHAFEEGNTRTTAVFFIKYLRTLGFNVTNDLFAKNSWYFRNALVRANYTNLSKRIYEDRSFLIKFLRNLLLGEKNLLKNRELRISYEQKQEENSRETRIIELIKANPQITIVELSKKLGVSERTIKSIIKALSNRNIVLRTNGKRFGYWKINS